MRFLPGLLLFLVCVHNVVRADRIAAGVAKQWDGKRVPRYLGWVFGSPPSASHIRKVNAPGAILFGISFVASLAAG